MSGDDYYFDTSALLPYYREENTSPEVQTVLSQIHPPVLLSDLTRVEMASAIARWARMKEIEEPQAALIENTFEQDIRLGLFRVQPLAPIHYQKTEKWLSARKTALRTLDAIHIACCWGLHAKLITCDHIMHDAAEMLGLESVLIG